MKRIAPEEIGNILTRLVIADAVFAENLISSAKRAGNKLLADDVEKLEDWLTMTRILASCIK